MKHRYVALDWMRGIVMVLMAVDHGSGAFNRGRLFTDSAFLYEAGTRLPALQFFTRWITHACAPTFLFLAGTGSPWAWSGGGEPASRTPPSTSIC